MFQSNVFHINVKGDLCYLTVPSFEETGLVRHAFSTRLGGVSKGQYAKMNLSFHNGDRKEDVYENFRRIFSAIGGNQDRLVMSRQEHTDNIRIIFEKDVGKGIQKEPDYTAVDGMITHQKNIPLVTLYADCVPLIFLDPVKKVIASSHSGWRGTVKQIGKKTVSLMQSKYDSKPENILAAILPCIGPCCYEVDEPLYTAFSEMDCLKAKDVLIKTEKKGKYMLDLPKANQLILLSAGIQEKNLTITDVCTHCNADTLHSHRATGGHRGNLAAILELK